MKSIRVFTLFFLISMTLILGVTKIGEAQQKWPVKIGALGEFTGAHTVYGDEERFAITVAAAEINEAGGVNGNKIEVYWADNKGEVAMSVTGAHRLVNKDNVLVVMGPITSGGTLASMRVTERAKVPHMASSGAHEHITKLGNKWVFRNSISDFYQASLLADGLIEVGYKKVAIFNDSEEYGKGGARSFTARFQYQAPEGVKLVGQEVHERKDVDYRGQLLRLKQGDPDVIVLWTASYDAAKIIKQAKELGLKCDFAGPTALSTPDMIPLLGKESEGLVITTSWIPSLTDPRSMKFKKMIRERFSKDVPESYLPHFPDNHGAQFYDGVNIVVKAIKQANLTFNPAKLEEERAKLRDALETIGYDGITGPIQCTPGDHDMLKSVLITQVKGGEKRMLRRVTY